MGHQEVAEPFDKGIYENWWAVEKSIRKFDRFHNKIEKWESRHFLDHDNHDRREARMVAKKTERANNFTYFYGGLSEEEQMYKDYYETDVENEEDDEGLNEIDDELNMGWSNEFSHDKFDFQEQSLNFEASESIEDVIDAKIFKYKYRVANDSPTTYMRRMDRVAKRSLQRAETRDPIIEQDMTELM